MFEIPPNLHPANMPLAFLLGAWEGEGVVEYPTIQRRLFKQRVEFAQNGKPFLHYISRSWEIDQAGNELGPLNMETGFWRPRPDDKRDDQEGTPLEVLLSHPTGFLEAMIGEIRGPRIEFATTGVMKVESAKDYRRGHRLYGLVNGELMWVYEMEAMGEQLQPHISAALQRAPAG
ncbi:FABP family protein [Sporichthya polymorpha]|uniref:FABP family protein n=1 Tax=Sporichthya polymorpha TaxID=35751 RepID=UPI00035F62ED|nr:FABP family protein [Sporichthya polymorpha]